MGPPKLCDGRRLNKQKIKQATHTHELNDSHLQFSGRVQSNDSPAVVAWLAGAVCFRSSDPGVREECCSKGYARLFPSAEALDVDWEAPPDADMAPSKVHERAQVRDTRT